jgi:hypothetical protein
MAAAAPMALIAAAWWLAARRAGLENDLAASLGSVGPATAIARLPVIAAGLAKAAIEPYESEPWLLAFGALPWALLLAAILVLRDLLATRRLFLEQAIAPAQVFLYATVLAFTPHGIEWHVQTSLSRLIHQCAAAFLVFLLAAAAPPWRRPPRDALPWTSPAPSPSLHPGAS